MLDVRAVAGLHKHVTFKLGYADFRLHSEMEEVSMRRFRDAVDRLREERQEPLAQATAVAAKALAQATDDDVLRQALLTYSERVYSLEDSQATVIARVKLMNLAHRHFGGFMLWCPKNG